MALGDRFGGEETTGHLTSFSAALGAPAKGAPRTRQSHRRVHWSCLVLEASPNCTGTPGPASRVPARRALLVPPPRFAPAPLWSGPGRQPGSDKIPDHVG